ncbi:MAG: AarF/ABC1/UbiB kinase family protein [Cyanobacteria bacterium P01_F01_bin.150]
MPTTASYPSSSSSTTVAVNGQVANGYSANGQSTNGFISPSPTYDVSVVSVNDGQQHSSDSFAAAGRPESDTQLNWEHVQYDHHSQTEPLRYDAEEIAAHYGRRPLEVLQRVLGIFWPMIVFALSILWDKRLGRLEKNERKRAIQIREIVTRLGPAYIKVGQALSTRPDLLPAVYLDEFTRLQDQIPPFSNKLAFQFIKEELGQAPDQIYAELSEKPIAAASLGQVYKGRLKTGETVAVKVQRPDLADQIALDIYILRNLAELAQSLIKQNRSDLVAIMDEFGERIFEEMDYINEGQNAERFAKLYGHLQDIYVPTIYWQYTNRRVLTMEWIDGIKLTEPNRIKEQGGNAEYLVEMGVQCSLRQLLEHGFFHADPHPGNLLATPDGKLAYLDFGMMSQVKAKQRYGLLEAVVHLVNRDFDSLAQDYIKLEFLTSDVDLTPIIPAFASVFGDALGSSVASLNFKSITDQLSDLMYEYPFKVPAYYALIIRSLVTLEGIAIKVDPEFKVLSKAYPYVAKRLLTDQAPELRASLQDLLFKDGTFRWNRLENLLRNASNSQDYDLNKILDQTIDFIFSDQGTFIREYLVLELVTAADEFGQNSWQQLITTLQQPVVLPRSWAEMSQGWDEFRDRVSSLSNFSPMNFSLSNFNFSGPMQNGHHNGKPANSAQEVEKTSNFEHIVRILGILRDTPGFDPQLIVNLVPRLLAKSELQQMGMDIFSQLTQRAIARFIRDFFDLTPDGSVKQREHNGHSDRKSLPGVLS